MKKLIFLSAILITQLHGFATIDTLRHYNLATANSNSYLNAAWYPEQYACFEPPAPGYIKGITITLGGSANTGSVTVHFLGHEGGDPVPLLENDLITPITVNKTIAGTQKITVNLPTPLRIDNNLFFIKVDKFSPNITLLKDKTTHAPFCTSASGGDYYMQYAKTSNGFMPFNNAFIIDVIMDYTEGLTSPRYFKDITAAAGIDTTLYNYFISWADINKDGLLDLLVNGKLYKNMGNGKFTDITASAGIVSSGSSTFIDMNNDGKDDILFVANGANFIYINNGDETFTKHALNLTNPIVSLSTFTIGDFNNDGYPDLFVGQLWTSRTDAGGNYQETYYPHYLYMNDKNLGFIDTSSLIRPASLSWQMDTTIVGTTRAVRGAQFVDYNDDGKLDLFVGNYRLQPDELWKNNGNGTFTDVAQLLGLDINSQGGNGHATGCDWADYNNDGYVDLLLPQLAHPRFLMYDHRPTTVYKNNGPPTFDFIDMNPGVNKGLGIEYEETHAGANWGDLNNDGLLDFAISVFYGCRYADVYLQKPDHSFEMKSFAFGVKDISAAEDLALVDFDNDGKLDMAYGINPGELGASFRLFKNYGPFYNSYVELDLVSTSGNKDAVGAKIIVYAGGKAHTQYQMPYHGAYMSKGNRIHVGLGNATKIDSVVVRWPNGTMKTEKFTGVTINNWNILTEGGQVVVGMQENNQLITGLSIYPNPAASIVTFDYELTTNTTVTLEIYSVLGQKITLYNNEKQNAGKQTLQWNAKGQAVPGIYSYRLQAGDLQKTGLLVVE